MSLTDDELRKLAEITNRHNLVWSEAFTQAADEIASLKAENQDLKRRLAGAETDQFNANQCFAHADSRAMKAEKERDELQAKLVVAEAQRGHAQVMINALIKDQECARRPGRSVPPEPCGLADCECCAAADHYVTEWKKQRDEALAKLAEAEGFLAEALDKVTAQLNIATEALAALDKE